MKTMIIIAILLSLTSLLLVAWLWYRDRKVGKEVIDTQDNQSADPAPGQETETEPKFKVGDYVVGDYGSGRIVEITDDAYLLDTGIGLFFTNNSIRLWDITKDAKDGDVLLTKECEEPKIVFILKGNVPKNCVCGFYCYYNIMYPHFATDKEEGCLAPECKDLIPAAKEQRDLLFSKMAEAGYTWDAETKTLSKIEKPAPEPVGTEEPTPDEIFRKNLDELLSYFSQVVPVGEKTKNYILNLEAPTIDKDCFPVIYDYFGTQDNKLAGAQGWAWVVGLILSELVPEKREELMVLAYNFMIKGKDQPTYGFAFNSDPNIMRMTAAVIYAVNRDASVIPELRKEVGGKMVTYKNDVSELYIDCTKFMPTARPPFIKGYEKRPKGTPVDADNTACMDERINDYVAQYYNLDTKDAEKRQRTIQSIADKEYHKQHLFGKDRTVTDKAYGTMAIRPVFGKHNLGIEIPDDGAIANLIYDMGKICSATRISLLDQEYGRRRPGMGDTDGSMNPDERHRALVNYAIEEGDGHTTGYYDKGGYYVDGNGNYIGDYVTFYQGQLYANSYPSGHSAFIMGVGMLLMEVMPDKADLILKALIEFANGRIICRYHNQSDVIYGLIIGSMMIPVLHATTNYDLDSMVDKAKEEYQRILNGDVTPEPAPTDKVNVELSYSCGGYGSCHVDAGETSISHKCNKEANRDRQPSIICSQTVNFTIEGGMTTADGKTSGVFEAGKSYVLNCPAVEEGEEKISTITLKNSGGTRILYYKRSWLGTHDDGPGTY